MVVQRLLRPVLGQSGLRRLKSLIRDPLQVWASPPRTCPICHFTGRFLTAGAAVLRRRCLCPNCGSLERHRLFCLYLQEQIARQEDGLLRRSILHVAPEEPIRNYILSNLKPNRYTTADIAARGVDRQEDLTQLSLEDDSVDVVIANDVLEHIVDDRRALSEVFRVLHPGGRFFCTVPLVQEWAHTYEDPAIVTPSERENHFGQVNHVRYYGRDFVDRLAEPGFAVDVFHARPQDYPVFGLALGARSSLERSRDKDARTVARAERTTQTPAMHSQGRIANTYATAWSRTTLHNFPIPRYHVCEAALLIWTTKRIQIGRVRSIARVAQRYDEPAGRQLLVNAARRVRLEKLARIIHERQRAPVCRRARGWRLGRDRRVGWGCGGTGSVGAGCPVARGGSLRALAARSAQLAWWG